ncbi:hypothetical protein BGZ99_004294 [Dissophora globulifera]|uniref:Uncharacterized protein n=1 Tax=Dissophora globulifera TaxID=979702 RepID=A0A9P6UUW8_9FUNG|nr:hypothetical protein BGZ99_004294 [Dissophora globulifera]
MELPSSQQHAALPSFGRSYTNRDRWEVACSQPMSFSTTGLVDKSSRVTDRLSLGDQADGRMVDATVQQTRSLGSSESTLDSLSKAVPPYLRAYISKEPIFTSEQINAKNAPKSSCSDTDGVRSKDISFYSPSGTLFSQSREFGLLLDRITSFDNTLKSFHSCFEVLQDRMAERDVSAATSREDQKDLLADFESRIGDRIAAALGQESKKMVEACVQELLNVANSTHEQQQQHQHWQTQLQESQNRLIREELSNWKTSVENTLREDMRELRSVVALQSQMLTTITEKSDNIKQKELQEQQRQAIERYVLASQR